ncbi:MAG: hypothetical protein LBN74_08240 [Prevotella sp.]|jgi:hypothetical protein|nr:hypothetical protein [Prevotella sp.]
MNAINDFLLNLFTGTDTELRPLMTFPNLKDGLVSASDGHVLIQIPNEHLTLGYQTNDRYPNANKLVNDLESKNLSSITAKIADVAKELTKARLTIDKDSIKCKECKGTGEVEWEYRDKDYITHYKDEECPICNGEGSSETDAQFARVKFDQIEDKDTGVHSGIYIGDLYFHPFQLYRLFMVALVKGFEEIKILYDKEQYGQTITYFGDIKVLVMLIMKPEIEKGLRDEMQIGRAIIEHTKEHED